MSRSIYIDLITRLHRQYCIERYKLTDELYERFGQNELPDMQAELPQMLDWYTHHTNNGLPTEYRPLIDYFHILCRSRFYARSCLVLDQLVPNFPYHEEGFPRWGSTGGLSY